jgi:hypothetical protein
MKSPTGTRTLSLIFLALAVLTLTSALIPNTSANDSSQTRAPATVSQERKTTPSKAGATQAAGQKDAPPPVAPIDTIVDGCFPDYTFTESSGASIVPGTTLVPNTQGDDQFGTVQLPFSYTFYNGTFTQANLSTNGNLQFGTGNTAFSNSALPASGFDNAIFALWTDLHTSTSVTGGGIYTSVSGVSPNQIFNIEWRARECCTGGNPNTIFEIRLYEGQTRFDVIYGPLAPEAGNSATIGVQRAPLSTNFTQYSFDGPSPAPGTQLTFTEAATCPLPRLAISNVTQAEGNSGSNTFTFNVDVTNPNASPITVNYSTQDGTATAGSDYTGVTNGTLTIPANTASVPLTINVNADTQLENDETFFVNLTSATNAVIAVRQANATITNDDPGIVANVIDKFTQDPLAGITFTLTDTNGNTLNTCTTGSDGQCIFTVAEGGNYVLTPSAPGYRFNPASTTFINLSGVLTATFNAYRPSAVTDSSLLISEFRFRGNNPDGAGNPSGALDEFVEIYNNTDADIVVGDTNGDPVNGRVGFALVAYNNGTPATLASIPEATRIPARGHYLIAHSSRSGGKIVNPKSEPIPSGSPVGTEYSLSNIATPDARCTTDILDDTGVALFNTSTPVNFDIAHRLDAVGFNNPTAPVPAPYLRGTGLPPIGANDGQYSFVRRVPGPPTGSAGFPQNTMDNAADFDFVSNTGGVFNSVQSILGLPGPENLNSPTVSNNVRPSLLDPSVSQIGAPNRVRLFCGAPGAPACVGENADPNGYNGYLSIRRRFTNNTGFDISRLRFRITDITTLNSPSPSPGQADLRAVSSDDVEATVMSATVTVSGTTLDFPELQPLNGGLNSTLMVFFSPAPLGKGSGVLANGDSVDVQFLLGVNQAGRFRFFVSAEAEYAGGIELASRNIKPATTGQPSIKPALIKQPSSVKRR